MISKKKCIVVVPVFKSVSSLNENELFSLKNNSVKLRNWAHVLIGPEHVDWEEYQKLFFAWGLTMQVETFDSQFFAGVAGYNDLLTSVEFYKRFWNFKYILICQLDAYVFKDELEYWCNKKYDFIGAPWFEGWKSGESTNIIGVGNGGFSLRNVHTSLKILKRINRLKIYESFWKKKPFPQIITFEKLTKRNPFFRISHTSDLNKLTLINSINEDFFWTNIVAGIFKDYKVAPVEMAIKFSFEVNPAFLFKMNNYQLPFGCHAWEKYEPVFWKSFIDTQNA